MEAASVDHAIEQYHRALDAFLKGDPEPMKDLYSHRDDVTLANPFGLPVRGWRQVAETMERAASYYRDGEVVSFDRVTKCQTKDLAFTVEVERYRAKVGGAEELVPVAVRVTTVFRPEGGTWKVIHRHADPISSPQSPESVVTR